jgi:hypothetical protein
VGVDAFEIEVEVHAGWGEEGKVTVVGLPDTAVRESKDQVRSACSSDGSQRGRANHRGAVSDAFSVSFFSKLLMLCDGFLSSLILECADLILMIGSGLA